MLLGLCATLDIARPGDRILAVSFGSGAGADAFSLTVTEKIDDVRSLAPSTQAYLQRRTEIDYATYARCREKIDMDA